MRAGKNFPRYTLTTFQNCFQEIPLLDYFCHHDIWWILINAFSYRVHIYHKVQQVGVGRGGGGGGSKSRPTHSFEWKVNYFY